MNDRISLSRSQIAAANSILDNYLNRCKNEQLGSANNGNDFTPFALDAIRREMFTQAANAAIARQRNNPFCSSQASVFTHNSNKYGGGAGRSSNHHTFGYSRGSGNRNGYSRNRNSFHHQHQPEPHYRSRGFPTQGRHKRMHLTNVQHLSNNQENHRHLTFAENHHHLTKASLLNQNKEAKDSIEHPSMMIRCRDDQTMDSQTGPLAQPPPKTTLSNHSSGSPLDIINSGGPPLNKSSGTTTTSNRKRSYRDLDAPPLDEAPSIDDRRQVVRYADTLTFPEGEDDFEKELRAAELDRKRAVDNANKKFTRKQNNSSIYSSRSPSNAGSPSVSMKRYNTSSPSPWTLSCNGENGVMCQRSLEKCDGLSNEEEDSMPVLDADQILKHLTNGQSKVDSNKVDNQVTTAELCRDFGDMFLASKTLAKEHQLCLRSLPAHFTNYDNCMVVGSRRDFNRRLLREYTQYTGCSRLAKPLTNFQLFGALKEMWTIHDESCKENRNVNKPLPKRSSLIFCSNELTG